MHAGGAFSLEPPPQKRGWWRSLRSSAGRSKNTARAAGRLPTGPLSGGTQKDVVVVVKRVVLQEGSFNVRPH